MVVLVTGVAGFIGYHTARRLLEQGVHVVGVDNLNAYYDPKLKNARLANLGIFPGFTFVRTDIAHRDAMAQLFCQCQPERVIHLAAQAGVRYSMENPYAYVDANLVGFINILEECRQHGIAHLVYASSSSVYGANRTSPFSVHHNVDHPVSLYAATKKANELMAHTYSHLYGLPTTGLRFFSVYGPWGRPDMALYLFTRAILAGEPIAVYNHGKMKRDFTYIDDIVEGVVRVLDRIPIAREDLATGLDELSPGESHAPWKIYNIGHHTPIPLMHFIDVIEACLGKKAVRNLQPMQLGDVPESCADVTELMADTGFSPTTTIEEGIPRFVAWYRSYHSPENAGATL